MREVIVDTDEVFGLSICKFIPENDADRELLQELDIKPFTGEMWHIEDDKIIYETIGDPEGQHEIIRQ